MAGDTTKAGRWAALDVWVAPLGTTPPADGTATPGAGWELIGFMHPDGLKQDMDEDSSTLVAYGGTPIEDVSKFNGMSFAFTAIEDNDVVWGLVFDGSEAPTTASGVTTRVAKVPVRSPRAWLIRQERADGTKKQRSIKKGVGRPTSFNDENETDLAGTEITVNVLADSANELLTETITAAV